MRRPITSLLTLTFSLRSAAVLLTLAAVQPAVAGAPLTPEQVVALHSVQGAVLSPDGKTIVYTLSVPRSADEEPGRGHLEIWTVSAAGGEPRALTHAPGRSAAPAFSPDGRTVAFLAKRGDDEETQIYLLSLAGGEARRLTAAETAVQSFAWSPDGSSLAYVATDPEPEGKEEEEKAGRDWTVAGENERPHRLWKVALDSGESSRVSTDSSSAWHFDWFPDGKRLVATVSDRPDTDSSYIHKRVATVPVAGGRLRTLWDGPGKMGAPRVSADGSRVAVNAAVTANDPAAGSLFIIDAATGEAVNRTPGLAATVTWVGWSRGREEALFVAHEGTGTLLGAVPVTSGAPLRLAAGPPIFSAASFADDGRVAAVVASTAVHPNEVFVIDAEGTPARLTDSNPFLADTALGSQEVYRWTASDGVAIEGILIRPVGAGTSAGPRPPYPLVSVVHGGPESCWHDGWNTSYGRWGQVLAGRGYAVLMANYRGSTGRGVGYARSDHRDLAGREFRDILDGIDALVAEGLVDPARVGSGGGSYGGYFSAWAATRHSDRFAAAIVFAGITNWISFTGTSDIPEENSTVHWDLDPYARADLAWDRSPVAHLDGADTPVLIAHGEKDLRVPPGQGVELYTALRLRGKEVQLVTYPREPHGLRERAHQLDYMHRSLDWFDRWLKGKKK